MTPEELWIESPAERRRHALLQAAALIYSTSEFGFGVSEAVDRAVMLLHEIEKRQERKQEAAK